MPVPLAAIAIGAGLAKLGVDIGTNIKQRKNFNEAQKNRPEYEIPESLKDAYGEAQRQYEFGEIPGYSEMMGRIGQSEANAVDAAQQGGNALGMIPLIQANTNKASQDLEVANADFRQSNLDRVLRMSQAMSAAEDREFQMNDMAPWRSEYNFNQNMTGLSNQMFTSAIDNLGFGASMMGGDKEINTTQLAMSFWGK